MKSAALCLVISTAGAVAAQPQPPRDTRAAPSPRGAAVAGRVLDDRETPVPGAAVYLVGGPSPGARTAITTEEGRFTIVDLDPATYTLALSKSGYPFIEYGQVRPGGPGAPIVLQADQRLVLTIHVPRGAVITGLVVDDLGEPAPGHQVVAAPPSAPASSIRRTGAHTRADRQGRFRIFGLHAGTYRVAVAPPGDAFGVPPASAVTVTIAPGEERDAGGLRVPSPALTTEVTVVPMASDGQALRLVRAELRRPGEVRPAYSYGTRSADGATTIANVRAGQYKAVARTETYWGSADITVDGERPVTVPVTLAPGVRITGSVVFDATGPPIPRGTYVSVTPADLDGVISDGNQSVIGALGTDGRFALVGVPPGRYLVRLSGNREPEGWTLESATVGEIDAADVPLEVRRDDITGLAVTLTRARTSVNGAIVSATGAPVNGVDIVVFPSDPRYRTRGTRRVGTARTNIEGEFEVSGLPPGAYEIAIVEEPDREALQDPATLAALRSASRVTLRKGEALTHKIVLPR